MPRALRFILTAAASMLLVGTVQAEPAGIAGAIPQNAFINCLLWTREGVPVSDLAEPGRLVLETQGAPSGRDTVWSRSIGGERLLLVQHNDGSQACSLFFWTSNPESIVAAIENVFSRNGEDWPLDFRAEGTSESNGDEVRTYRQHSDKHIFLAVSIFAAPAEGAPSAALTFAYTH